MLLRYFTLKTQNNYLLYTLFLSVFSSFLYSQEKNISLDSISDLKNNTSSLTLATYKPTLFIANASTLQVFNNSLHIQEGTIIIVGSFPTEKNIEKITSICTTIKPQKLYKPSPKQEKIIKKKTIIKSFPIQNNPFAPSNSFINSKAIVSSITPQYHNKLLKSQYKPVNNLLPYHNLDLSIILHNDNNISILLEKNTHTPLSKFSLAIIARPPPYIG